MATAADICNLALATIGVKKFINALTDNSPEAQACNAVWDHSRKKTLEDAWWDFATARVALSAAGQTKPAYWTQAYAYPSSPVCVRMRSIEQSAGDNPLTEEPYAVECDSSGARVIFCNVATARGIFTCDDQDTTKYPPDFVEALSARIAAELVIPLAGQPQLAEKMVARYKKAVQDARLANLAERPFSSPPEAESIRGRL